MTHTLRIAFVALALAVAGTSARVSAQVGPHVEDPWNEYRGLYNQRSYAEAIPYAIEAIQREPDNATYYLGLARGYFWLESYELATFYYDLYLEQFGPTLPTNTPANNRVDRVRAERDSSNQARTAPATPVAPPEAQQQARAMLLQRIEEGTILTTTGGGAWPVWQGLLRSGYARPDLLFLRRELAAALLAEAELFVPADRASLPSMAENQWTTQRQRLTHWQQLQGVAPPSRDGDDSLEAGLQRLRNAAPGSAEQRHARAAGMLALAEGQLQYLNMNWDRALVLFEEAIAFDRRLLPAHMGRLNAMYHHASTTGAARDAALEAFASALSDQEEDRQVLRIYRASFLAQDRRGPEATAILADLLGL